MTLNHGQLFKAFRFHRSKLQVKVYISYDIINSAPLDTYEYLINPANEALVGTRFAYFPVGGPVPKLPSNLKQTTSSVLLHESSSSSSSSTESFMKSSTWGGMEVGENMLYSVQVVDGEVHEQCGTPLLNYLQALPVLGKDEAGQDVRCPVGSAVLSPSFGSFVNYFRNIVHTVAPFYSDEKWEQLLLNCYLRSFDIVFNQSRQEQATQTGVAATSTTTTTTTSSTSGVTVASVVLGAGCRGIPFNEAAAVAAKACGEYNDKCAKDVYSVDENEMDKHELHFLLREEEHASVLSRCIEDNTNAEIIL